MGKRMKLTVNIDELPEKVERKREERKICVWYDSAV